MVADGTIQSTMAINNVPVGIASYSDDIFLFGKAELHGKFRNIVQYQYMPDGGHFASMEDADRLYQEYYNFILIVENNKGKRKKIISNEL